MGQRRISALICSDSALMAQGISVAIDAIFQQVSILCFTPHFEHPRPNALGYSLVIIDSSSDFGQAVIEQLNNAINRQPITFLIGDDQPAKLRFKYYSIPRGIDLHSFEAKIRSVISTEYDVREPPANLTPMQEQVAHLLVQGMVNKEIGRQLAISEATVRTHLTAIYRRLRVKNRTEAAVVAREYFISHGR